jgi:1-pyrroline-5-carboxylate dehydrogenase
LFSVGYFIEPTIVETSTPTDKIFREEIFGPLVTIFVYKDSDAVKTLDNVINGNLQLKLK